MEDLDGLFGFSAREREPSPKVQIASASQAVHGVVADLDRTRRGDQPVEESLGLGHPGRSPADTFCGHEQRLASLPAERVFLAAERSDVGQFKLLLAQLAGHVLPHREVQPGAPGEGAGLGELL